MLRTNFGSFFFRYSCSALIFIASALYPNPLTPILLRLALHRWRCRLLELEPVRVRPLTYGEPRRFDTPLAAELAGVAVDDVTAVIEVLDEPQPRPAGAQQARQRRLAPVMKRS